MKPKQFVVWNIQSIDPKTGKAWYIKYILTIKIVHHYSDSSQGESCIVYLTELYCSRLIYLINEIHSPNIPMMAGRYILSYIDLVL